MPLDGHALDAAVESLLGCARVYAGGKRHALEEVEMRAARTALENILPAMWHASHCAEPCPEMDFLRTEERRAAAALAAAVPDIDPFMERVFGSFLNDWMRRSALVHLRENQVFAAAQDEAYESYEKWTQPTPRYKLELRSRYAAGEERLEVWLNFSSLGNALAFGRRLFDDPAIGCLGAFTGHIDPEHLLPGRIVDCVHDAVVAEMFWGDGMPGASIVQALLGTWPQETEAPFVVCVRLSGPDAEVRIPMDTAKDVRAFLALCRGQSSLIRSLEVEREGSRQPLPLQWPAPRPSVQPPDRLVEADEPTFAQIRAEAFRELCQDRLLQFLDLAAENPGLSPANLLLALGQMPPQEPASRILSPQAWQRAGKPLPREESGLVLRMHTGPAGYVYQQMFCSGFANHVLGAVPRADRLFPGASPKQTALRVCTQVRAQFEAPSGMEPEDAAFLERCAQYVACRSLGLPAPSMDGIEYAGCKRDLNASVLQLSLPAARLAAERICRCVPGRTPERTVHTAGRDR